MNRSKWTSRPRREQSWVLLLLGFILAVLAVVVARWQDGRSELLAGLAVLVGVGGVLLARLKDDAKARDIRAELLEKSILMTGRKTKHPPTVARTTLESLGVHPARLEIPYLHRDAEAQLVDVLGSGSPALVLGPSMAGKTRMAAQVVRDNYANRVIVIPDAGGVANLFNGGHMPHDAVIWLNDLERYIENPENLKGRWIDELTEAGNVVVATMRESAYEGFQPTGDLPRTQWELLVRFRTVRLLDDDDERQRLVEQSGDARIGAGISRYGVGVYIGGGFLAVDRWESGQSQHPLGAALIHAAVDWRRSGIAEVIPQATAESLAPAYLTPRQVDDGREDLLTAIGWATDWKTGAGAFRLLSPADGGWRPFDYLLDHIATRGDQIPDQAWEEIARADAPPGNLVTAGTTAYQSGQEAAAVQLFRRSADLGNSDGMTVLGILLGRRGETGQAEALYRRAAGLGNAGGMTNLGVLLERRGETEQAEQLFRQAAGLGNATGMSNLGALLGRRGETEQAEALYRRAAGLGDAGAMTNLGTLLAGRDETEQAEQLLREAAHLGDAGGMDNLGALLAGRGETEQAEQLFREAARLGNAGGMDNLAILLYRRGETEQAEALYREAARLGDTEAMIAVGALLYGRGETEQAEQLFRQAADLGNATAVTNLGALLHGRGETEQAEALYRDAARLGNATAVTNLAILLHGRGETGQAEQLFRQAAGLGDTEAMMALGALLYGRGETEQAEQLFRQAADLGDARATYNLAVLLAQRGETGQAEQLFRQAADLGYPNDL
ncbi:tetratricopeptide repeat protein [Arthrobacter sp. ov118]|uniref:tetratricopeptide repeat protein n=1 Tax=Arthrobacter sp. ov118 TaxID=1761747 RepID=UPI0008E6891A|nr:tetratricopeptide repeat protein [Arthrobacter sp. ov118]SFU11227.1 TPR repeat [Arthrobacter sp. ov118]